MDYSILVTVIDRLHYLFKDVAGFKFCEKFLVDDEIKELSPCAKLGNEINIFVILEILIQLKNIRVVKCL